MSRKVIDFRSDTVTRPCAEMRKAMAEAEVGDDVYGDDPTVNRLERFAAELSGHESALFCSSGTQTNLLALMTHCRRGDEYIVGGNAHTYKYEGGGAAVLGSIQPQPIEFEADGTLDLAKVVAAIKEDDFHFAQTKLLALENTTGGKVVSQDYIDQARKTARENNLVFHLDGARVCNAAVAQSVSIADIATKFDSVSICLSKGLGAPIGSVLCGDKAVVSEARRIRKMLGGGMRQAGVIAAAALFALQNNVERLADDHANAQRLATSLSSIGSNDLAVVDVQTNMVFVQLPAETLIAITEYLSGHNVTFVNNPPGSGIPKRRMETTRLILHKDIDSSDVDRVASLISDFFDQKDVANG